MLTDSRQLPHESYSIQLWRYARSKRQLLTTCYAFKKIVLDVLTEKFNTIMQSVLLHSDIPGYDLPALNFVSPPEEVQETDILKEEDSMIYTHLEKVFTYD